ncbi:extracellular catalytic domain type 1 short-chain-length polyhydroxyalkanoate depolymerase, partial [Bradyrhizobium sp.]|uniref:extracellular catalytic domain type 1 short-chain-length polyhydroxyalkanoate depolymerase n=1 Tax=Bradyrhizobium sp. TaxID=376 RepID=UPI003C391A9A
MKAGLIAGAPLGSLAPSDHLTETPQFGSNPGALRMFSFVPPGLQDGCPLVVVLHGCTQSAASYDLGAGWSTLAERFGFALLLPEQQRLNNPNGCFNWFQSEDIERGHGEAASIRQMVMTMVSNHGIDPARVFVTGLSAGGAMTS